VRACVCLSVCGDGCNAWDAGLVDDDTSADNCLLTFEQLAELKGCFRFFRDPTTRRISPESLRDALIRTGCPVALDKCTALVSDWSATGSLGLSEFLSLFALKVKELSSDAELRAAFELLDDNNDGLVEVCLRPVT
jgi:Ca2+-binding EF-hand superfamily protein